MLENGLLLTTSTALFHIEPPGL